MVFRIQGAGWGRLILGLVYSLLSGLVSVPTFLVQQILYGDQFNETCRNIHYIDGIPNSVDVSSCNSNYLKYIAHHIYKMTR